MIINTTNHLFTEFIGISPMSAQHEKTKKKHKDIGGSSCREKSNSNLGSRYHILKGRYQPQQKRTHVKSTTEG